MTSLHFNSVDFKNFDKNFRVHLINSLGGFKSVVMVATKNPNGIENIGIFSSLVHIGANPPLIGLIFRPSPPIRDTFKNIIETSYYTINHIHKDILLKAHQCSAKYDENVSEFKEVGLTPNYLNDFSAPFVKESHIKIGLKFIEKIDILSNRTILIIGEIQEVYLPENALQKDGFIDLEQAKTLTCSGLDSYHETQKINRLSYAKPDKTLIFID